MSTISLPQSTLDQLDKLSRSFVWGSTGGQRKMHLIAWDRVRVPKADGGLGIRSPKHMNKSLLAKLGWRLMQDEKSLWSRVLRSKYKVGDIRDQSWLVGKSSWSSTWKGVCSGIREVVIPGIRWIIGDGRGVRFWHDKWLNEQPIGDLLVGELQMPHANATVRDLWLNDTGWDLQHISPYVSNEVCLQLSSRVVDTITGMKDRMSWGECSNGQFTVRSAYELLTRDITPKQQMECFFGRIWKVTAPERVRLFIWLVGHQALMTNVERHRRHLCSSGICQVCKGGDESIIHVLRDCPAMSGIWTRLVPLEKQGCFFKMSLLEWIYDNFGETQAVRGCPWATLFALAIWWGWKWRCEDVFGVRRTCRDRVKFVRDIATEVWNAHVKVRNNTPVVTRVERMIAWKPPPGGWFNKPT